MKKYLWVLFFVLFNSGIVFGAPEEHDVTFQTVNPVGTTNANIAAN